MNQEPGDRGLFKALEDLGETYGNFRVALAAAQLTDTEAVINRLRNELVGLTPEPATPEPPPVVPDPEAKQQVAFMHVETTSDSLAGCRAKAHEAAKRYFEGEGVTYELMHQGAEAQLHHDLQGRAIMIEFRTRWLVEAKFVLRHRSAGN